MKRKNLAVFAIFVSLVVGYAGYDYWSTQRDEKRSSEQRLLLTANPDQVQKVALHMNGKDIELERQAEGWKMTKPVQDAGNAVVIDQYIEGIATEKSQNTVAEGDKLDLAAFGLDHPKGVIELGLNSGQTVRFTIGQMKNYQGDAYLRKDDEAKVMIVSSTWFSKVEKTAGDFRDKRLMRRSNATTEKIFYEKGTEKFQLIKKDGQWQAVGHSDWKLDQNKVRELLAQLNSTEALEFIAEGDAKPAELKKWQLDPPQFRLQVESSADSKLKPWTAGFAAGPDKVFRVHVSEPNQVLKIAPSELGKFQILTLDSFRDRSEPFQFDHSKVKKVDIKLGEKTFNLKSDDPKVQELMKQFDKVKVAEFTTGKHAPFEQEISLKDESDKEIFKFQWGGLHSVANSQGNRTVFSAKSSLLPQEFSISESDLNLLNLNEITSKASVQ